MRISELMTKEVLSVLPSTPFIQAAALLVKNNYSGLPVVDEENNIVGVLTEYDMIIRGSQLHMPTFISLLEQLPVHSRDKSPFNANLQKIIDLKVADVMNPDPLTTEENSSIDDVVRIFAEHHRVNPIPVISHDKKLVGIISRFDIIKFFAPADVLEAQEIANKRNLDTSISLFIRSFRRRFVLVSRYRTAYWLLISFSFMLIGFIIAMALMLRIVINGY
ncbi:MAG: CBS domain-containing protein [Patescibacteria group bacterium]